MDEPARPERTPPLELRLAVRRGEVDRVRVLLEAGVDPNVAPAGTSPLVLAAVEGSNEIVELLLTHGADPAWVSRSGWTAATFADANEFGDLSDRLVAAGAPPSSPTAHGYTQLHRAARSGAIKQVPDDLGPEDIDALDASGDTPLALAVRFRRRDAAVALLEAGANPNHMNDGWPILATAVYEDSRPGPSSSFVELLVAAGADVNPAGAYPPLFCAINQEWSSGIVLARMVSVGADIGALGGWEHETVLHRIASIADADLVDTALGLGARIEARNQEGRTPLHAAAEAANDETFVRLVERGADLGARDGSGRSVEDLLGESTASAGSDRIREFVAARSQQG